MKLAKHIQDFERFIEYVKTLDETIWLCPISEGKWTLKEVIAHLWNWDVYTLEVMVPLMKDQAQLPGFVDHDTYNQKAIEKSKQFKNKDILVSAFNETRSILANQFKIMDPDMKFFIGNDKSPYTIERYIKIFTHHDEYHRKQIEEIASRPFPSVT